MLMYLNIKLPEELLEQFITKIDEEGKPGFIHDKSTVIRKMISYYIKGKINPKTIQTKPRDKNATLTVIFGHSDKSLVDKFVKNPKWNNILIELIALYTNNNLC